MDDDNVTPARAIREGFRWTPVVLILGALAIAVVTALALFVWHVAGVFQAKNIQRNYSNTVNSQQYQQSLVAQMQQHLSNIAGLTTTEEGAPRGERPVIRAQKANELQQFCAESINYIIIQGDPLGSQMDGVIDANCTAGGIVIPNAPLER